MQGAQEIPDSKSILIFVLLADMLNSICREIVSLSAPDDSERRAAGIATVVLFVLVIVLFFGILSSINVIYLCCKYVNNKEALFFKMAFLLVEILGATLYFYGDNISFIFDQYGDALGCSQQCMENNRIAAVITLGLALMFYHLFPPCLHKVATLCELPEPTPWYSASSMMTTILKVDALFTIVVIMAQTTDFCSNVDLSISVAFLVISVVVGIILMIVYSAISYSSNQDKEWRWIVPLACILLVVIFPMYILADNLQPLDCAFGCDTFAFNQTQNEISCNEVGNSALRLGFTVVAFITVAFLSSVFFCCRHNTKGEKVV